MEKPDIRELLKKQTQIIHSAEKRCLRAQGFDPSYAYIGKDEAIEIIKEMTDIEITSVINLSQEIKTALER